MGKTNPLTSHDALAGRIDLECDLRAVHGVIEKHDQLNQRDQHQHVQPPFPLEAAGEPAEKSFPAKVSGRKLFVQD